MEIAREHRRPGYGASAIPDGPVFRSENVTIGWTLGYHWRTIAARRLIAAPQALQSATRLQIAGLDRLGVVGLVEGRAGRTPDHGHPGIVWHEPGQRVGRIRQPHVRPPLRI